MINISEPKISKENVRSVVNALNGNSVSTYGKEVGQFEKLIGKHCYLDTVCVNSGTSALEISIDCCFEDLARRTKKIIGFCDYTFVATSNAILNTGNIPFSIPCDPNDFTIDLNYLETLFDQPKKLDLLIVTFPFGNYHIKTQEIVRICKKNGIPIIFDAAASIGLKFNEIKNIFSDCVSICLSFNGNKVITSGGGGAILSNDTMFLERVRNLITLNRISNYEHSAPGQNKKMPALNAALGKSQILELEEKLNSRFQIYKFYYELKDGFFDLGFRLFPDGQYHLDAHWIYFLYPISPDIDVDIFRLKLKKNGYNSPSFWKPISKQRVYKKYIMTDKNAPKVNYPDLLQLPMTLENPKTEVSRLFEVMRGTI